MYTEGDNYFIPEASLGEMTMHTTLIIIGITGDLSRRKLLPAVEKILRAKAVGPLRVIGVTRQELSTDEILAGSLGSTDLLRPVFETYQMNLTDIDDFVRLKSYLKDIASQSDEPTQVLFYLSIPPQIALPVVELLGQSGIAKDRSTKLLLEKPFGVDLGSARELIEQATHYFNEEQLYRIDHYMAKEMTQNLVVFRQNNSLFRRTWNNQFIESIEIVASEVIDIEGRATFYEQTGALRDLVQSHLLQLAALTLANLPADRQSIPYERLKALQLIKTPYDINATTIRGQYAGYPQEVAIPQTTVETFVSLTLESNDPRWVGVPITLTTGKALDKKATEIRLTYKQDTAEEANTLTFRIQPNEGVEIELWAKQPGYSAELQKVPLDFVYAGHFSDLPDAYERVFVDAIRSDRALFTTSDEVLETWRILEPVQQAWSMESTPLISYSKGSTVEDILSKAESS
jgi:glucose-6-phosphate 1-dehydrogenase